MLPSTAPGDVPVNNSLPETKSTALDAPELESSHRLNVYRRAHRWDPNLEELYSEENVGENPGTDANAGINAIDAFAKNSYYAELSVRAAVRDDDEDVPANTLRAWAIGLFLTTIGSALNALFTLRAPAITITSIVALLLAHPIGVGWEKAMPSWKFRAFGLQWNLNPGPFNVKEHALIVIMANASFGTGVSYFTDTIQVQKMFYKVDFGWGWNICLAITTQITGFGIAGIARRVLVEPASMIWPQDLVSAAFLYTLHDDKHPNPRTTNGWKIGRYRYFIYVFVGSFLWYWIPGLIAPFLSVFAFVTWTKPNNAIVNQLFGGWTGLSLIPITFDWTQVAGYLLSPLISPWHAIANTLIGAVLFYIVTTAALQYTNSFYAQYLPISDAEVYDNTGKLYNVSRVLAPNYTLDEAKYKAYSPIFLSTTFILSYGISFATVTALVVHTIIFQGRQIWTIVRDVHGESDDVHTRMMRKYKHVPQWWYIVLLVVCVGLCFVTVLAWPTLLTWWALMLAVFISAIWLVPIGMIQATTGIHIGLDVFTEFIIGYILPGRPLAMMLFKTYGYITMTQALAFIQDLKLGHYLKVPPRATFWGQLIATLWSCVVQLCVLMWGLNNIPGVCTPDQPQHFTCPNAKVFFAGSVIWGLIGPARMFSGSAIYTNLQYFWIAGAVTPIIFYVMARVWPSSGARFLNAPILFGGASLIPPATLLNYLSWGLVGFLFQKYIRNRFRGWWMQYNYITSASLDSGLAICTIVIVLIFNMTGTEFPGYWGNREALRTLDSTHGAVRETVPEGKTFGPTSW